MRQKSKSTPVSSEGVVRVRDIRRATRKHHAAEKQIRIVLDGLRGETSIAELCRREGIAESMYYSFEGVPRGRQTPACRGHRSCGDDRRAQAAPDGRRVDGMNLEQGRAILDEMQAWATQPQFVYRHEWTAGDLLIWDNTGLIRQRPHCSVGRVGEEPIA